VDLHTYLNHQLKVLKRLIKI